MTASVVHKVRRAVLLHDGVGLTDGRLLDLFIDHRDAAAFAALIRRHGPMVWGVCRRLLDRHDAEDAFQATFLVLVRKAASVVPRERVGNWLYGVARRTALQARRTVARRTGRERRVADVPEPAVPEDALSCDLRPLLDQELSRLPDRYRTVVVLCDLEGNTRQEAARQLGVPEGSVSGWLARGRAMLAKRLTRRGVALPAGAVAAVLGRAAEGVPPSVVSSTIGAACVYAAGRAPVAGAVPAGVAALTEGVLKAMFLTKLKGLVPVAMATLAITVGVGVGLLGPGRATGQRKEDNKAGAAAPDREVSGSDRDQLLGKWRLISCKCNGEDRKEQPWNKDALLVIEEADGRLKCKTVFKDKAKLIETFGEEIEKRMLWAEMAGESPEKVAEGFCEELEKSTQGILKPDARRKPKTLDLISVVPLHGIYLGVYKLDGDTLT